MRKSPNYYGKEIHNIDGLRIFIDVAEPKKRGKKNIRINIRQDKSEKYTPKFTQVSPYGASVRFESI